jgi:hypothetical protein
MAILAIPAVRTQTAPPLGLFALTTFVSLELQGLFVLQLMTAPLIQRFAWMDFSTFASVSTLSVSKLGVVEAGAILAMLVMLTLIAPPKETSVTAASARPLGEATTTLVQMQTIVFSLSTLSALLDYVHA